jgi:hypothetical protein
MEQTIEQIIRGIQAACDKQRISIIDASNKAEVAPSTIYRFITTGNIMLKTLTVFMNKGLGLKFETVLRMGK